MASPFNVTRVPYLDIQDTIDEVGISRRQLDHWEAQELMTPELGPEARKYTVKDILRLKALRHLIVEQKLPISLVKELVDGGSDYSVSLVKYLLETASLFSQDFDLSNKVLELPEGKLSNEAVFARRWWNSTYATANEGLIENTVYDLVLLLFRVVQEEHPRPAAFVERRDAILNEINILAQVARVEFEAWGDAEHDRYMYWSPSLDGDFDLTIDSLKQWFRDRAVRLARFRDELQLRDPERFEKFSNRFWSNASESRLSRSWRPKPQSAEGDATPLDMDDVPF